MKPSTHEWPDWPMRSASVSETGQGCGGACARFVDAAAVCGDERGGKLVRRHQATELGHQIDRLERVPFGFFPVACAPLEVGHVPERFLFEHGIVSRARDGQHLVVERPRSVDLCRPDELVPEVEGRAVVEGPAWQRSLEEDSVFHRRACNATAGVEVHVPVGTGCEAAEGDVVDA